MTIPIAASRHASNAIRQFFRRHDRGQVNIGAGNGGHDRGVGDPQIFDAKDPAGTNEPRALLRNGRSPVNTLPPYRCLRGMCQ